MILTGEMIIDELSNSAECYSNPRMKITRETKKGNLIRLKRDLYVDDPSTPEIALAQVIYGPSYISFEYALSYYGIIPERARTVTCATFGKHKDKRFDTKICSYYYTDVPEKVFPMEVKQACIGDYSYNIATMEKAVCDKLYKMRPVMNQNELEVMIFDDLRFDEDMIFDLNITTIEKLADDYRCRNVSLLSNYLMGQAIA